jgi:two-component system chemotaxis sensor kinase CheA
MDDGMDEIVQEFLVESYENLDQLDQDLVALEADPISRDLLSSIFRTIHTIKGTSGFLAFNRLEAVTHVGENLLARLRDGQMTMTPVAADALLAMVDVVRALLSQIEKDGTEGAVRVDTVVTTVSALLEPATPAAAQPDAAENSVAPGPEAAETIDVPVPAVAPAEAQSEPVTVPVTEPVSVPVVEPLATAEPLGAAPAAAPAATPDGPEQTKRAASETSVRVDVDLLDSLMRLVGELVLSRNQILASSTRDGDTLAATQHLNVITTELQEGILKTRMQTIDRLWSKLPRMVRDLSAQVGKQVHLEMTGGDTELDRSLLEAVKDPLTHLVRNALDHGLETAPERTTAGKPAVGTLTVSATHEGGQVVVEVRDDGRGIDHTKIAAKALERGLRTREELDRLTTGETLDLIFLPGFSTAAAVTNVSGRGVGMDVVRTNIEAIGGTVEMSSSPGSGTTCRLRIPLTLAIMPALTVTADGDRYALPQANLLELVSLSTPAAAAALDDIGGAPVYRLRGDLLPLVDLRTVLDLPPLAADDTEHPVLAVLTADQQRFGLVVDKVHATEEIVVKPISGHLKALGVYSGATILGDGNVALLLDAAGIARRTLGADSAALTATTESPAAVATSQMLVVAVGDSRRVAVPLSMVTRLETFPAAAVETLGNRTVVQYREDILPLLSLASYLRHQPRPRGPEADVLALVYSSHGRSVAIAVDEVIDIVDMDENAISDLSDNGLLGSAVIAGHVTELLDVRAAITTADPDFYTAAPEGGLQ